MLKINLKIKVTARTKEEYPSLLRKGSAIVLIHIEI